MKLEEEVLFNLNFLNCLKKKNCNVVCIDVSFECVTDVCAKKFDKVETWMGDQGKGLWIKPVMNSYDLVVEL